MRSVQSLRHVLQLEKSGTDSTFDNFKSSIESLFQSQITMICQFGTLSIFLSVSCLGFRLGDFRRVRLGVIRIVKICSVKICGIGLPLDLPLRRRPD